ncbi:MAG TPA: PilZ domain-containing protein [Thermodesulfovibrionia bacterium]|nr:PilZ domain-containing protein [Thermodesulfovibrionia bacterium]
MVENLESYFSIDLLVYLFFGDRQDKRVNTRLLGWNKGVFLLTTFPPASDNKQTIMSGSRCIGRFIHQSLVLSFETRVLKLESFPAPLLYLQYPKHITTSALRKSKRYQTSIKCKVKDIVNNEAMICIVTDISKKGCRVAFPAQSKFHLKNRLHLTLKHEAVGLLNGIYIAKRNETLSGDSVEVGFEIVGFTNNDVKNRYEEFVNFYGSMPEIFEETVSKLNSIFIE